MSENEHELDPMQGEIQVRARQANWYGGIEVLIRQWERETRNLCYAARLIMSEHDEAMSVEPTLHLSLENAQLLMDDLWASGIRPTEGRLDTGRVEAMAAHLKDMQALIWRLLPAVLEEKHERE